MGMSEIQWSEGSAEAAIGDRAVIGEQIVARLRTGAANIFLTVFLELRGQFGSLFSDLGQGLGPLLWPQSALSWLHCSVEPHVAPSVLPCPCVIHLEATLVRLPCS